jgi:ABC-type uncharacterized transport system substrate-binding protein
MISRPSLTILILSAVCLQTGTAVAHPHVWVTMMSELIYAADGSAVGVRHHWTFDDVFSVFATQGLESKKRGVFTRDELAPLAEVNVTSLKEYAFFTFAKADGKKLQVGEPVDYYLDYDPKRTVLTLHFTLPFKTPVKAKQLNVDIYDPTYFVDFAFAEKNPMALVGAPAACKFSITRPQDATVQAQRLPEAFFNSLDASGGWGTQFANKVSVKCP